MNGRDTSSIGGSDTPPGSTDLDHEEDCGEECIFYEKGKNEIFGFEKLENLKIRKEVTE